MLRKTLNRADARLAAPADQKSHRHRSALGLMSVLFLVLSNPGRPALAEPTSAPSGGGHWAFRPVEKPMPPPVEREGLVRTPVDRFILRRLEEQGLQLSPPADQRTLIRRATYDMTGLPPAPEDVEAFVRDDSPDAYARLIDRLLQSPQYGEHWARYWLDVARYSDTKGYVYAREERFSVHSPLYRDWIVRAFNENLPYDRFLVLQLAADQAARDPRDPAAMGFLTLGRRFLGVTPDIIDDRIDVVTRGTLGLTVSCARCHDHKYDPIPTADYYSLYGVFENCVEEMVPIRRAAESPAPSAEFEKELTARKRKLAETLAAKRVEAGERLRRRITDYLLAQRNLQAYPQQGFDQILSKDDLIPAIVWRWEAYLAQAARHRDPVFVPWLAFTNIPDEDFADRAAQVTRELMSADGPPINRRIRSAFEEPPQSPKDVAERYGRVFAEIDREWLALCEAGEREQRDRPKSLPDTDDEALRQVLYGPGSPCVIPDEPIVNTEALFDSGTVNELWRLQGEVDRWILQSPAAAPHAVILSDRSFQVEPRVFRRGNPAQKERWVPRRFLKILNGPDREPFTTGSGRLELARAIASPDNPLTARVWVNRVWMHHFGTGLVTTPSDFGLRSDPPSHPELLDWLASEFVESGWSTKSLHRLMMLSAVYQQRSRGPEDIEARQRAQRLDPENRLLWRMPARRLTFEELRDSLLTVSGELDLTPGGKPVELFPTDGSAFRRSIYGLIDRQFVPTVLRVFDFANPDLHTPHRIETTVPQQALFALNHPFVAGRARAIVDRFGPAASGSETEQIVHLYRTVLQRKPTEAELAASLAFLSAAQSAPAPEGPSATARSWSYGYGELNEEAGRLKSFHPLPYFTGSAWQGGAQWPDSALGWVQLTAQGGHAGNDRQHAAVRRWTAPEDGIVTVTSKAVHEVAAGDGIRCWIVSSRHGVLASATLHNASRSLSVDRIEVRAGDTLDFLVDCNANLNSDQYVWAPEIRAAGDSPGTSDSAALVWSAERDFAGPAQPMLAPWEQLVQVLLLSNEFMFVD